MKEYIYIVHEGYKGEGGHMVLAAPTLEVATSEIVKALDTHLNKWGKKFTQIKDTEWSDGDDHFYRIFKVPYISI